MKKTPEILLNQIINLVSELAKMAGVSSSKRSAKPHKSHSLEKKRPVGATGGIRLLVGEGKLDSPKTLSEIIEFLRQEGRHYSRPTVSMGLLNLVRERVLTRIRDKGDKKWKYVTRR